MSIIINPIRFGFTSSHANRKHFEQQKDKVSFESKKFNAMNISKNVHIGLWNSLIFRTLDNISPLMDRYPKFTKKMLSLGEKMIMHTGDLAVK